MSRHAAARVVTTYTVPDNLLLNALPRAVRTAVTASFERVTLPYRVTIYEPGKAVEAIYFPIDAVISVVTTMQDGTQIEVITVGREGLTGAQAALNDPVVSSLTWCQVAGDAYRVDVSTFSELCRIHVPFRSIIERFLSAQVDVMAQLIACNRLHYVNERCARWLLTTHDRVGRDDFPLTHENLATMLGVRRAGVSVAAGALQQAGCIRYVRGKFRIIERSALIDAACECYGAINDALERRRFPAA